MQVYFILLHLLEYGEKENEDLRERFEVNKDDYPVYKLFKQGQKEPIDFTQSVTADDLARFVRMEGGLWLGKMFLFSVKSCLK